MAEQILNIFWLNYKRMFKLIALQEKFLLFVIVIIFIIMQDHIKIKIFNKELLNPIIFALI